MLNAECSELPAHSIIHVMGGVITSAHLSVVVQLDLEVVLGDDVDVGPHYRKVPMGVSVTKAKVLPAWLRRASSPRLLMEYSC